MRFHSHTSQYGTLSRARELPFAPEILKFFERAMTGIRDVWLAEEWRREQEAGYHSFKRLRSEAEAHPLNEVGKNVRQLLKHEAR